MAIRIEVNNGRYIEINQKEPDGEIEVSVKGEVRYTIPAGDMVMLLNLYRYVKKEDIQNDFINPNGMNSYKRNG